MLESVKGLVIRSVDVKESDRLITVYTEEQGIITALAKGARSLKSRNMSATQLFCYSKFILYKKGENCYIRESELIESFFDLRKSIEGLALASYILEIMCDVCTAVPERELLRLSLNSLYAISSGKYNLALIKGAFEIRCASILGFMPYVLSCSDCGASDGDFYFDIMDGRITCYDCHQSAQNQNREIEDPHESRIIMILTAGVKTAIAYSVHAPLERLFSFALNERELSDFSSACELYILNQLERNFKSLDFYKEVTQ
jgi:DNA repair protein RecO (recombination protein O)